jgi:acylphosphatase
MASDQQRRVVFRGHVQGVGFRATTQQIARRFAVVGFVRNLPDRTVELIVEGAPGELDAMLSEIDSELRDRIADKIIDSLPASGNYSSFEIRN